MNFYTEDKPIAMTTGLMHTLNDAWILYLLVFLQQLIKTGIEMDYLQIFVISQQKEDSNVYWKVKHSQEVPEWERVYTIPVTKENSTDCRFTNLEVYTIDDGKCITFMLPEER